MTIALLLNALLTYGPTILPLVQKLVTDIEAGRGNATVTSADLADLVRLAGLTGEDIYAKAGVTPPPKP